MTDYLDLAKQLMAVPSVTQDQAKVKLCAQVIIDYLGADFQVQTIESEGFTSYVISRHLVKDFDVFLYGHLDVVPGEVESFKPKVNEGKLLGRGGFDMKASIAVEVELIKKVGLNNLKVALVLVPDEEVGGQNGLNKVLEAGYTAKVAVVPDGGFGDSIVIAEKGVSIYKLKSRGTGGHSSRPWEGENQVEKLYQLYQTLLNDLQIKNEYQDFGLTVNLGVMRGGDKFNSIPEWAEMELDFRYYSMDDKEKIKSYFSCINEQGIECECGVAADVFNIEPDNEYLQAFKSTAEKHFAKELPFTKQFGSSDARYLSAYNIPAINFQPTGSGNHKKNEWVSLLGLKRFYQTVQDFLLHLDNNA
ncbi:M20 family metallopeptidase [Candidatus Falkowbacteria bacterium]|jgi:succinyl-diaminopimelate desuccinylase|nr:M20 family metallopeptidase [Candidatus Falkowbacteria bacterium]MBT6573947.1 M20 family metallopeptidase [Candidatus Falkowbacteria bacterium]MBT7348357.1 M20 family metallopeptidase [Candidatus Falkowbacteria bacterium]MBT7500258.1 M20 family metallopeptidase [Candidatus Falkowbacteria bacterium]